MLRTLAGEPRAEGARRLKPADLGRILGLDRAPEVKTIRRKHQELAAQTHAVELLVALGKHHLASTEPTGEGDALGLLLYVDGHVRSYQGSKKIGKQYSTRLKYPVPASMETWVSDASGAPVFMVMAAPSKNLVGELRGLVPQLRALVGDQRRVLIGFDREGWSPALFEYLYEQGFDVLTWRKGSIPDLDPGIFRKARFTNQWGQDHEWKQAADTVVGVEVDAKARKNAEAAGEASDETGALVPSVGVTVDGMFGMRQVSRIVAAGKQVRESTGEADRQIHLLTTNTTLSAGELIFHIGRRWRQENYFRYARQHFALDSHDTYQHTVDDVTRSVPNPAKEKAKQARDAAAAVVSTLSSVADAQMLRLNTPEPGETRVVSNAEVNQINAPVIKAEQALHKATKKWEKIPARLPLGEVNPGQLVLETEHKQLLHAVRMSAFNASMAMVADIRSHTGLRSVFKDANEFVRQALTGSGDLDPRTDGFLDVVLDPLPTRRETVALGEMCERLSETRTRYPGTDRVLRYRVKNHC
ncbi:putative transposase [Glutamicibacter arilaitensis]|uniref:putative transposase n=1 Tax=Glutamicibacter arilaitensis TaxID=256701 RepID=UPI003FD56181